MACCALLMTSVWQESAREALWGVPGNAKPTVAGRAAATP
jgi:hypothetical protein